MVLGCLAWCDEGWVVGVLVRFDDFLATALVLVTVVCGAFVMALVYADVW